MILFPKNDEQTEFLAAWAARALGGIDLGPCQCLGVVVDERLTAVIVYHNYRDGTIETSFATEGPRWATRGAMKTLISYPFDCLGVRRLSAITAKKNKRARKLLEGVGFIFEGILHAAFANGDGCMYAMTRTYYERSRWNGQKRTQAAASARR